MSTGDVQDAESEAVGRPVWGTGAATGVGSMPGEDAR
jgi:hypothetical protein